ncbi:putative lipoprotein, partial [Leptospira interrogans serovar Copenhageni str. LT2050]
MKTLRFKTILFIGIVSFFGSCIYRDIRVPGLSTNYTQ